MNRTIRVGITHGDINGVGYEVILGSLANEDILDICTPVVFGYHSLAEKCRKMLGLNDMKFFRAASADAVRDGQINVVEISQTVPEHTPGIPTQKSGKAAVEALQLAVEALEAGNIDVLVTAPISKEAVQSDSFHFPGHTEFLEAAIGKGQKARMILFNDEVRVALVSTHLPIAKVAGAVTPDSVTAAIESMAASLTRDFGFDRPRVAVLSLNPHAGDGGLLGNEEAEVIIPAINRAKENGILAFGPYPADGFFGMGDYTRFDGIVAMYHDQGLAPFKTLAGQSGVNYTAGLPYVRTSPDHGTAFSIAWKGEADPTSMREAIYKAMDIFRNRRIYDEMSASPLQHQVMERSERSDRPRRRENPDKAAETDSNPNI